MRSLALSTAVVAVASAGVAVATQSLLGPYLRTVAFDERVALLIMWTTYAAIVVGPVVSTLALVLGRIGALRRLVAGPWLFATVAFVATMALVGPVAGFHHMYRLGVLGWAVLDCESRDELGQCGLEGSAGSLVATLAAWVGLVFLLRRRAAGSPGARASQ